METGTCSQCVPRFRLLDESQIVRIHHAVLRILDEVGVYYGIPIWGTAGCSDAQFPDLQAGAEYSFTLLNAALDGTNLIHDCGYMGQGFIAAPEMILFANEVIDMVKRYMRGFELDEPHLAVDVIKKVGPGGHFLGEKHTLDFFMKEHWCPAFFNRENLPNWIRNGKKAINEKLIEKAVEISKIHSPAPLSEGVKHDLDKIWEDANRKARR